MTSYVARDAKYRLDNAFDMMPMTNIAKTSLKVIERKALREAGL